MIRRALPSDQTEADNKPELEILSCALCRNVERSLSLLSAGRAAYSRRRCRRAPDTGLAGEAVAQMAGDNLRGLLASQAERRMEVWR